ncbi:MAG: glutamine--fructose-6-phosphate aminotransferase, partial [Anaerolineae bacterium]
MCGIVGYIGPRDATPIILQGLKRLEYRGYDSAGLAVLQNGHIEVRRDAGKLSRLQSLVEQQPISGHIGIGHTRWATHGEPNARNAHPHVGMTGEVVVVHNGIVENFLELREELMAEGAEFRSDTDTETIVHLVERLMGASQTLEQAAMQAFHRLRGHQSVVLLSSREPDKIVAARLGNAGGVVIGYGEGEMFVASDLPAILEHTRRVVFLENGEMAVVTADGVRIQTLEGQPIARQPQIVPWDPVAAEKGEYRHFMQKEIH